MSTVSLPWFSVTFRVSSLALDPHLALHFIAAMKAKVDGKQMNVIFDPMVHTPNGCVFIYFKNLNCFQVQVCCCRISGPGDHGKAGIERYLKVHQCNSKCQELGLKPLELEDEDDSGSE